MKRGFVFAFFKKPASVSLDLMLRIGASNLSLRGFRLMADLCLTLLNFLCFALVIYVPRNSALDLFILVILVWFSFRVRPIEVRASLTWIFMDSASCFVPWIPMMKSSAYRTYSSFLYWWPRFARPQGVVSLSFAILLASSVLSVWRRFISWCPLRGRCFFGAKHALSFSKVAFILYTASSSWWR